MSTYAIIELSGKQFKVMEGDQFVTDRLDCEEEKSFVNDKVLFVKDGEDFKIGQPYVHQAKVEIKIVQHQRSKKLRVAKYKAKSRYRRVRGHRQHQSLVEIISIN
ncbi:MAG: 50S ribosomal protein L21 [Patescibacteria group bacterium]|nr:50S ribosomal protein L21 [Patescibacteria group bacterium]